MRKKDKESRDEKVPAPIRYIDDDVPRSFVIQHGIVNSNVRVLLTDFKRLMKPNTAERLLAKKKNAVSDFASMAGRLGVSHLLMFSQSDEHITLKIGRLPQGPTLSFQVNDYTLMKDIISNQKKSLISNKLFQYAPCLMTNLQPEKGEQHLQLCSKMFLDMFPTITPSEVRTTHIKRCCLINYNKEDSSFDMRHYAIRTKPVGITKATKKILGNRIPDLSRFKEISDFVTKSEVLSDSEPEDNPDSHVTIEKKKKGISRKQRSTIRLSEIGPRITLKLMKIEDKLCSGTVLHHSYLKKTPEEILLIEKALVANKKLLKIRKKQQLENIKKKEDKKESHREKCLKGMGIDPDYRPVEPVDDDRAYYKEEIGEEPDEDTFKPRSNRPYRPANFKKRSFNFGGTKKPGKFIKKN